MTSKQEIKFEHNSFIYVYYDEIISKLNLLFDKRKSFKM